jgi:hypothetical protein
MNPSRFFLLTSLLGVLAACGSSDNGAARPPAGPFDIGAFQSH